MILIPQGGPYPPQPSKILVLCHGNINRSALAHAAIKKVSSGVLAVKSAGFVNPGRRAAKKMREAAGARGFDLEQHRSTLITHDLISWADVILYMDGGNKRRLCEKLCSWGDLTVSGDCLGRWADTPRKRIADPAFMPKASAEFAETVDLLIECSFNFVNDMIGL